MLKEIEDELKNEKPEDKKFSLNKKTSQHKNQLKVISTIANAISNNPPASYKEVYDVFTHVSIMNYYQRPAFFGTTFHPVQFDRDYAYENLKKTLKILKPDIILFCSKKAGECFKQSIYDECKR